MIKFLKLLSNIVDPNYWASKISKKTGLEERPYLQGVKPKAKAWPDPEQLSILIELVKSSSKPMDR